MIDPKFDDVLDDLRKSAIRLQRVDLPVAFSKLGGLPWLPANVPWPRHARSGLPLHFLAQIDLVQLPKTPLPGDPFGPRLPREGVLFFFADIDEELIWMDDENTSDQDATRVIFAASPGTPAPAPHDLPEIIHPPGEDKGHYSCGIRVYPEAALEAFVIDTYVGAEAYFQGEASAQADLRTLASIERATGRSAPTVEGAFSRPLTRHQMLGAATNVQGTAEDARDAGLVLLLQLDSDCELHDKFMFCDMGMAQFWIRPQDLRDGHFESAWATTEGG